jgi:hypothetical protein
LLLGVEVLKYEYYCSMPLVHNFTNVTEANGKYVGFEAFTAVTMKNSVLRDVAPCRSCEINRRFGGTYRLHLQGRKIRERGTSVATRTSINTAAYLMPKPATGYDPEPLPITHTPENVSL